MLSKLVRGPALKAVQPHLWKSAGDSLARVQAPQQFDIEAGPPAPDASDERILLLQARQTQLEATAESRVREARDSGFREGETAGRKQGAAEVLPAVEKLARSIQDLAGLRPKLRDQAEADVVRLALAIARRVVNRELNTDPDSITGLVKVAFNRLRVQEAVRVRVHPAHQASVREFLSHSAGSAHIEVSGDVAVGLGGVVFETSRGEFDVSTDVQLNEIEKGLADRLAS